MCFGCFRVCWRGALAVGPSSNGCGPTPHRADGSKVQKRQPLRRAQLSAHSPGLTSGPSHRAESHYRKRCTACFSAPGDFSDSGFFGTAWRPHSHSGGVQVAHLEGVVDLVVVAPAARVRDVAHGPGAALDVLREDRHAELAQPVTEHPALRRVVHVRVAQGQDPRARRDLQIGNSRTITEMRSKRTAKP